MTASLAAMDSIVSGAMRDDDMRVKQVTTSIEGGLGTDTIHGGDGNDRLFGHSQAATATTSDGNSTIRGGNGNDEIFSSAGNDLLHGEAGKDRIRAGAGNDRVYGGLDNDILHAGEGDDEVYGDSGDDRVHGGLGADRVEGGSGNDLLAANVIYDGIEATALEGEDEDIAGNELFGGTGDDRLFGSDKADVLSGGDCNDWLNALAVTINCMAETVETCCWAVQGPTRWRAALGVDRLVAIDGTADEIFPQPPSAITIERDEVWIDALDLATNVIAVGKVLSQHPDAVHVVGDIEPTTRSVSFKPSHLVVGSPRSD